MEALSVAEIPSGPEWQYEPKWDGFRCLVFREGDRIELQSKAGQPLTRYFPELVEDIRRVKTEKLVLDSEIVVPVERTFSFDALLQRIHPAQSRVNKLARETPALIIAFDLLLDGEGKSLIDLPLSERRRKLDLLSPKYFRGIPLRLENPKIGRVDDAEIVGNRIAEDGPVFRHLHAQEMQNGSAEVVVARVASVVGHVAMHQPP
jgi:ATP-dependent DNA ligase